METRSVVEARNSRQRVWMVVSSGYYDDIRVTKMANHLVGTRSIAEAVTVLAVNRAGQAPNAEERSVGSIDVRLYGTPSNQFRTRWRKAWSRLLFVVWAIRIIRRESAASDIIHCHDLDTAAIGLWARKSSQPVILDMHEVYSGRYGLPKPARWAFKLYERSVLPRVDGVVFVSRAAKEYYAARLPLSRVALVTNSRSLKEILAAPQHHDSIGQRCRLVYVGRFSAGRGLMELVRSMEYLRGGKFSLHLIGFGPLEKSLRSIAAELSEPELVQFLEPVPLDEVVKHVGHYDLGVVLTELSCLNHQLTVSNKLFEYAAAGLPMILSQAVEHQSILSDYNVGITAEVQAGAIADAVRIITQDGALVERARKDALRLATDRAWECEMMQLEELYISIRA
jgi:glycosyltransferase involved in cell wall biosynthesis